MFGVLGFKPNLQTNSVVEVGDGAVAHGDVLAFHVDAVSVEGKCWYSRGHAIAACAHESAGCEERLLLFDIDPNGDSFYNGVANLLGFEFTRKKKRGLGFSVLKTCTEGWKLGRELPWKTHIDKHMELR